MTSARKWSRQTLALLTAFAERPRTWQHGYELSKETGLKSRTLYAILLRQMPRPDYNPDVIHGRATPIVGEDDEPGPADERQREAPDGDPLYDDAMRIVTPERKASISYVQRRLKIGYNRAARIAQAMEEAGLLGAVQANGQREALAGAPPEDG